MRAAIVGAGGIARVHARLIAELGGTLVGVCGRTLDSARAMSGAPAYDNLAALLREQRPDVLHICSPNHLHAEHAIAAFEAGAHVMCEKPMATSVDECVRMIAAAERAGRVGGIAYTYRGYPLVEHLRARVAAGEFGNLRRIAGFYLSQDVLSPDKYAWLFTPGTTGRSYAMMDLGVHWLDLVEYVTGARVVEVFAQFSTHVKERVWRGLSGDGPQPQGRAEADGSVRVPVALEDQADLLLRLSNGAAGPFTVSGLSPGHPNTIILSADGPTLGFDWNQELPNTFIRRSAEGNAVVQRSPEMLPPDRAFMSRLPAGHAEGYADAFRNVVQQCWAAMRGEPGRYPSFRAGLRGIALIEAIVRSAAERVPVATG
jgi:predicted dehydrogenase